MKFILSIILMISLPIYAQFNSINIDLSNEYISRTYTNSLNPNKDIYRQNYLFRTDGYLFHPKLATFNFKSDLFILTDSQNSETTEKTLNSKNYGDYDFWLLLFPKQKTNLKIFSLQKRTNRIDKFLDKSESLVPINIFSETKINRSGFIINRSSQRHFPGISLNASRLTAQTSEDFTWVRDILDLKLFNQNQQAKSNYSLNFRAYDQDKNYGSNNEMKYDISLLTHSELSSKSKFSVRGNFIKYSKSESAIGDIRYFYNPSKILFNDFSFRVNQLKLTRSENVAYRILNRLRFDKYKNYRLRLSTSYNNSYINSHLGNNFIESGNIKPEIIFDKRNKFLHLNGSMFYNLGFIDNENEQGFTHNTYGQARISIEKLKSIRLAFTESVGYSKFINDMEMLRIKSGIELLIDFTNRLKAGGYLNWENSKYLADNNNEYSKLIFKGLINSQITNNIRAKFEHQYSTSYSSQTNNLSRTRLSISESGIIKNAIFHIVAERINMRDNDYLRDNINASVSYTILNFTITGGYWINYSNNLKFDEIRLIIHRPIGINL